MAEQRRIDPEARALGIKLRGVREDQGLTQVDVAQRLDMSDGGYSAYETGRARVFVSDLGRIAAALNVPSPYLARRLGLCGGDSPDIAQVLVERFGPQIGSTLVRLDRVLALMEQGDTAALSVLVGNTVGKYESAHAG